MSQAVASAIVITVFLDLGLFALWLAVGVGRERRPHFWSRVLLASLALPSLMVVLAGAARLNVLTTGAARAFVPLLLVLGVTALMFVPGRLYRAPGSSPGGGESDGGGGGGGGPGPPPASPPGPRGGVPLPDADQATVRVRDHNSPRFERAKRRPHPAREPRQPLMP